MKFLIGVAIGYGVTILQVPSSGRETRDRIRERFDFGAREKAREIARVPAKWPTKN